VVTRLEDEYACVREAKVVFGSDTDDYHLPEDDNHHSHRRGNLKSYRSDTVYQDVNFIHAHFSTVSKAIESLESCGALLHDSLELVQKATWSLNSAPGEIGEKIKCKLEMALNSNPGLKKIQLWDVVFTATPTYCCNKRLSLLQCHYVQGSQVARVTEECRRCGPEKGRFLEPDVVALKRGIM
jgi:hypothetical protein